MLFASRRGTAALLATLLLALALPARAEDRYAATTPANEGPGPLAWGTSLEDASEKALTACREKYKTCSTKPAATNEMDDVFAYMCCRSPKKGCAIAADNDFASAETRVREIFTDAGYSKCGDASFRRAGDGVPVSRDGTRVYERLNND